MQYKLQQEPVAQSIIEMAIRERRPIPDKFLNAPTLSQGLELYWYGYNELASFANLALVRTPILWADANAYAAQHDFDHEQRSVFMYCVAELEEIIKQHIKPKAGIKDGKPKSAFAAHSRSKNKAAR